MLLASRDLGLWIPIAIAIIVGVHLFRWRTSLRCRSITLDGISLRPRRTRMFADPRCLRSVAVGGIGYGCGALVSVVLLLLQTRPHGPSGVATPVGSKSRLSR